MRPFQLSPIRRFQWLSAGYCTHMEWVTLRGGSFRSVRFPAGFACLEHPTIGLILFDTGYSQRFFTETASLPACFYRWLTPVFYREQDSALAQLQSMGYDAKDVALIIISHFHGDHIAGLRDFPQSQFLYTANAYEKVRKLRGLTAVKAGFLPQLLPDDFEDRSIQISFNDSSLLSVSSSLSIDKAGSDHLTGNLARSVLARLPLHVKLPPGSPFPAGIDLFGDNSCIAIDLPGHADGQMGLFLSTDQKDYLLCADASWSSRAIINNLPPHRLASLIMSDRSAYQVTFSKLIQLNQRYPSLQIVPSHCLELQGMSALEGNA